jgi:YggT family protein
MLRFATSIVFPLIWSILFITNQDGGIVLVQAFSNRKQSRSSVSTRISGMDLSRHQRPHTDERINNNFNNNNIAFSRRRQSNINNKISSSSSSINMVDGESFMNVINNKQIDDTDTILHSISDNTNNVLTSFVLAQTTEVWVQPTILILDPLLNFMSFAMLARVVLSWYPEIKIKDVPWTAIVIFPTDPLLRLVKGVVPPAFGVDITPVFWLAIFTFIHEIFLGQQGLLTLKLKYGI